jgi:hypothetical protein
MRYAILVSDTFGRLPGSLGRTEHVKMILSDRKANDGAFPDESVVRLPRRISRRLTRLTRWNIACDNYHVACELDRILYNGQSPEWALPAA